MHRFKSSIGSNSNLTKDNLTTSSVPTIWFKVPYMGKVEGNPLHECIRKLKLKDEAKFKVPYDTKKLAMLCSNKDKIPKGFQSNCVYEFNCPDCSVRYIGKTEFGLWCH